MSTNDKKYLKNNKWKGERCSLSVPFKTNVRHGECDDPLLYPTKKRVPTTQEHHKPFQPLLPNAEVTPLVHRISPFFGASPNLWIYMHELKGEKVTRKQKKEKRRLPKRLKICAKYFPLVIFPNASGCSPL